MLTSKDSFHFRIVQSQICHAQGISDAIKLAHKLSVDSYHPSCPEYEQVCQQLSTFPEGQLVALSEVNGQERVIGIAAAMRTAISPFKESGPWMEMIGGLELKHHTPKGKWLYGVEMAVLPEFQGYGVGSAFYQTRFKLVRRLGLKGIYMGGMLKGYQNYHYKLSLEEYAAKVASGELRDPTVSTQMRRGFEAKGLIYNYDDDSDAGHAAMLLVWDSLKAQRLALSNTSKAAVNIKAFL